MRIACLVNQYPSVSHSFIRREIAAIEAAGHEVVRFAVRGWDAETPDPADAAEQSRTRHLMRGGAGLLLSAMARRAAAAPGPFLRALRAAVGLSRGSRRPLVAHLAYLGQACLLLDWLDAAPVDHLHAHFGTNPAAIAHLARILGGPRWSFTLHGQDEIEQAKGLHFASKMSTAAFAVAVSQHGRSQLLREIPHGDWNRVHVVHCGLDAGFLADDPPPLPDAPRLLTIARLSEEKGHLVLLLAFARLRAARPDATLTLAGDGPMRAAVEARIADLGLGDAVTITGWVSSERVRAEIAAARLVVQPSFIEGLPVVLMEAMAMGRPVISTFVGGIPELVSPATGWLVPAGDADALAATMETALSRPDAALSGMGAAGRAAARAGHDAAREAGRLLDLIEEARACAD